MIRAERSAGWGRQARGTQRGRGAERARPGPAPAPTPLSPPSLAQLIAPEDSRLTSQLLSSGLDGPPAHLLRTSAGTVTYFGIFSSLLLKPQKALDSDVIFQRKGRGKKTSKISHSFLSFTISSLSPKENLLAWAKRSWWGPEPDTDHS